MLESGQKNMLCDLIYFVEINFIFWVIIYIKFLYFIIIILYLHNLIK